MLLPKTGVLALFATLASSVTLPLPAVSPQRSSPRGPVGKLRRKRTRHRPDSVPGGGSSQPVPAPSLSPPGCDKGLPAQSKPHPAADSPSRAGLGGPLPRDHGTKRAAAGSAAARAPGAGRRRDNGPRRAGLRQPRVQPRLRRAAGRPGGSARVGAALQRAGRKETGEKLRGENGGRPAGVQERGAAPRSPPGQFAPG